MKKGGYQIIDLSAYKFTNGKSQIVKNIYNIIKHTKKIVLISGLTVDGAEYHDMFTVFIDYETFFCGLAQYEGNNICFVVNNDGSVAVNVVNNETDEPKKYDYNFLSFSGEYISKTGLTYHPDSPAGATYTEYDVGEFPLQTETLFGEATYTTGAYLRDVISTNAVVTKDKQYSVEWYFPKVENINYEHYHRLELKNGSLYHTRVVYKNGEFTITTSTIYGGVHRGTINCEEIFDNIGNVVGMKLTFEASRDITFFNLYEVFENTSNVEITATPLRIYNSYNDFGVLEIKTN